MTRDDWDEAIRQSAAVGDHSFLGPLSDWAEEVGHPLKAVYRYMAARALCPQPLYDGLLYRWGNALMARWRPRSPWAIAHALFVNLMPAPELPGRAGSQLQPGRYRSFDDACVALVLAAERLATSKAASAAEGGAQ